MQFNSQYLTYQEILNLDTISLIAEMEQYKFPVQTEILCSDDAKLASKSLGQISNNYSYLSSLLSVAKSSKRVYKREKKSEAYENMIDKEFIIENTLKAIDMQYKALSKAISLYMESVKELMYMGG